MVPEYLPSGSLDALQELADVAGQVPHEVARRAGLSTSELHSLRHLMNTPMGPVELARALGVTSAASSGVVDRLVARYRTVEGTRMIDDDADLAIGRARILAHPFLAGDA